MIRTWYKTMLALIKKIFIGFLTDLVNGSIQRKCGLLSIQKSENQPTLIVLHPNEYSQRLQYYSFSVQLQRSVESCNTINDLSNNKVFVPIKQEISL